MKAQEEKWRAGQEFSTEMNNNNSYVTGNGLQPWPRNVRLMCHNKSTQWEEQPSTVSIRQSVKREPIKAATIKGQQLKSRVVLRRGNAEEGLTAIKIKQLMTTTTKANSPSARSTTGDKRINPQLLGTTGKTLINGHVNDLKMRFEDGEMREMKPFQKAVDNVTAINRFALSKKVTTDTCPVDGNDDNNGSDNTSEDHEQDKDRVEEPTTVLIPKLEINESSEEEITSSSNSSGNSSSNSTEDLSATVVLRRNKRTINRSLERLTGDMPKYNILAEYGGSVHSLEDILNQQRFSRSLSQYSVSDLCWNESPAQISRDCQRFDELFCRSTEDLQRLSHRSHQNNGSDNNNNDNNNSTTDHSSPISKFGSMVDVVNL